MLHSFRFILHPPPEHTVESFLSQYDTDPRVVPEWPSSQRMSLVCVVVDDMGGPEEKDAVGYPVTRKEQVDEVVDFTQGKPIAALFYLVPRGVLLRPGVCPGLTEHSWDEQTSG